MENFVYQGDYIKVSELHLNQQIWEKVYLRGGLCIFPVTDNGKIILIKEKRPHETPNSRLKPVTGIYEEGVNLKENANRELQEEVGYKAGRLDVIKEIRTSGTVNNFLYIVLARDLVLSKIPNPDGEDTIMEIIPFSLEEILSMTLNDTLAWSLSTLGIFALYHQRERFGL